MAKASSKDYTKGTPQEGDRGCEPILETSDDITLNDLSSVGEECSQEQRHPLTWKIIASSVIGPSHEINNEDGQDDFFFSLSDDLLVAVVSDGAGSASSGGIGATIASQTIVKSIAISIRSLRDTSFLSGFSEETFDVDEWTKVISQAVAYTHDVVIDVRANSSSDKKTDQEILDEHHATIVGVVATANGGVLFHIGDGLGAVIQDQNWGEATLTLPENGEFANETFFYTEEHWHDHLRLTPFSQGQIILLMSDGAMPFVMAPKFEGVDEKFISPLTRYCETNPTEVATEGLRNILDGATARNISEDDKTLLWAQLSSQL